MLFLSELGKGSYARVVKVALADNKTVEKALKIQKPACMWEWYISKEIQYRLKFPEKVNNFIIYLCIYFKILICFASLFCYRYVIS